MSRHRHQVMLIGSMPSLLPCSRVRVDHRGQQVVGRTDRVHVAGEMQVELFHRHDLGIAAAGRAALDAEDRSERGLAQAEHRATAQQP
jgi:hypothetical protein